MKNKRIEQFVFNPASLRVLFLSDNEFTKVLYS